MGELRGEIRQVSVGVTAPEVAPRLVAFGSEESPQFLGAMASMVVHCGKEIDINGTLSTLLGLTQDGQRFKMKYVQHEIGNELKIFYASGGRDRVDILVAHRTDDEGTYYLASLASPSGRLEKVIHKKKGVPAVEIPLGVTEARFREEAKFWLDQERERIVLFRSQRACK